VSYLAHAATLALAWFAAVNALTSAAVVVAPMRAPRSAAQLLVVRLLPAVLSTVFVAVIFLPSYWVFEPRDFVEGFDLTLTAFAVAALAVIVTAAARGTRAWRRASLRARVWSGAAAPLSIAQCETPAFEVDANEPMMALVGLFRPRLIVTRGLVEALTPEEIAAGAAHEAAHGRTRDNLARLAMRFAPDLLHWTRTARRLERRWAAAAEYRADAAASIAGGRVARLALASALVKTARLMPAITPMEEPISTLVGGGEIAVRVERLIDDHGAGESPNRRRPCAGAIVLAAAAIPAFAVAYLPLLHAIHHATEILVQRLP
jgi:Zn-dependent protease with chaperone function